MYLGDDFGGSALQVGTYHRLADAIRRGCLVRPKKLKRGFRRGTDAADALGAAMATTEKADNKRYTKREIIEAFPELQSPVSHPVGGRQAPLLSIIMYLNDYSDWPREKIADWLCLTGGCPHEIYHRDFAPESPRPPVVERKPEVIVISGPLNFHNIAEAMRRGCLLRPRKIKGQWKTGTTGACALGAVSDGAGFRGNGMHWPELLKIFPELQGSMRHPLNGFKDKVSNVILSVRRYELFPRTDCRLALHRERLHACGPDKWVEFVDGFGQRVKFNPALFEVIEHGQRFGPRGAR